MEANWDEKCLTKVVDNKDILNGRVYMRFVM